MDLKQLFITGVAFALISSLCRLKLLKEKDKYGSKEIAAKQHIMGLKSILWFIVYVLAFPSLLGYNITQKILRS